MRKKEININMSVYNPDRTWSHPMGSVEVSIKQILESEDTTTLMLSNFELGGPDRHLKYLNKKHLIKLEEARIADKEKLIDFICKQLRENKLIKLDLSNSNLDAASLTRIVDELKTNHSLRDLNLSDINCLKNLHLFRKFPTSSSPEFSFFNLKCPVDYNLKQLATMIKTNNTLLRLDILPTQITKKLLPFFVEALQANTTMLKLKCLAEIDYRDIDNAPGSSKSDVQPSEIIRLIKRNQEFIPTRVALMILMLREGMYLSNSNAQSNSSPILPGRLFSKKLISTIASHACPEPNIEYAEKVYDSVSTIFNQR